MRRRPVLALLTAVLASGALAACGQQDDDVKQPGVAINLDGDASVNAGAKLFVERCSGCHNLDAVGSEGGAQKVHGRERTDGPNFNVRREDKESVLYAIRNGGFSGAIMPENIVVGREAEDVANFLAKYSGSGGDNERVDDGGGSGAPE